MGNNNEEIFHFLTKKKWGNIQNLFCLQENVKHILAFRHV
jgi:hypothetical protein